MSKFPVLLSIPHGGTQRPPELEGRLCITEHDQFDDSDPFAREIFDLGGTAAQVISADVARAYVDLNRSVEDLPPRNPDGLLKSMTCYKKPIYIPGKEPDEKLSSLLIENHYKPYHRKIRDSVANPDLKLCLDCHTMAAVAPVVSPDGYSKKRPLFCLSNQEGNTSTGEFIRILALCISESFGVSLEHISFNDPFKGGYITRTYGNKPIPWIQIEMNRSLYLGKQWFDRGNLSVDFSRLEELNQKFHDTLERFFKAI